MGACCSKGRYQGDALLAPIELPSTTADDIAIDIDTPVTERAEAPRAAAKIAPARIVQDDSDEEPPRRQQAVRRDDDSDEEDAASRRRRAAARRALSDDDEEDVVVPVSKSRRKRKVCRLEATITYDASARSLVVKAGQIVDLADRSFGMPDTYLKIYLAPDEDQVTKVRLAC